MIEYEIQKIFAPEDLAICIQMMLSSNPWNALYFTEEQCSADLTNDALEIYAAISPDKQILGFLASMRHGIGFEPMIEYLCIKENVRGKGIGTTLIKFFKDQLFPDSDNLYLFVSDINPDAMLLYNRLGYLQIGIFTDYNLIGQTEFLLRKSRRPRQESKKMLHEAVL
jgi:ribosomal protein S18 acetylase RimI-like enzyme